MRGERLTLLVRTRSGRHLHAVGGSAEAARRAGIELARIRIAFMISATMASLGGILFASRLRSVDIGMGLLGLSSGAKFVVTAIVLLSAVAVDSIARRGRQRSGLA